METVVDEKPLSFATSRIVIIDPFTFDRVTEDLSLISLRGANPVPVAGRKSYIDRAKNRALEFRADAGGHYSRVKRLSSIATGSALKFSVVSTLLLASLFTPLFTSRALAKPLQNAAVGGSGHPSAHTGSTALTSSQNPQELFTEGETALRNGDLGQAERAFRRVLALNPKVAGAHANLGVIYMRHKQWHQALEMLRTAERLAPSVPGVRLSIGLVYYRQNDFRSAIEPFETVVRDQPDSGLGRYLLGLCYFFIEHWADEVVTAADEGFATQLPYVCFPL